MEKNKILSQKPQKGKDLKYDNHIKIKEFTEKMRKRDLRLTYWLIFSIFPIITIISIAIAETLSFVIFAIFSFLLAIFSGKIINVIWTGIR